MERVVKFRVWCKESGEMISLGGHGPLEYERRSPEDEFRLVFGYHLHSDFVDGSIAKEDFVLMQFIGLQDNKGTDIYEGDILRVKDEGKEWIGSVVYGNHNCAFSLRVPEEAIRVPLNHFMATLSLAPTYDFEVLGNIYEHSDLLSKK